MALVHAFPFLYASLAFCSLATPKSPTYFTIQIDKSLLLLLLRCAQVKTNPRTEPLHI